MIRPVIALICLAVSPAVAFADETRRPPNIVFILADDLGYGELGCYGQTKIRTPHIDRLAAEGMRFTQCYAGCCVCAPSRSVLMTGLHAGHTPIRANGGGMSLADGDVTVAEVLKGAGYACGGFGKWGLGVEGTPGHPNRQGFDEWFGYLHQVHAHFYYPYWLWHNEERVFLPENEGRQQKRYAHDEIHARGLDFIRRHKDRPFFCYLPYTIPHVELVVPEDSLAPYRGRWDETPLPDPRAGYIGAEEPLATFAGMVSRLDGHVGEILALLRELNLEEETVVIFSSDNGGQGDAWRRVTDFFEGNGPLRGYKGSFYEGGLRVPLIVRWPGRVAAGTVSDHVCGFQDVLPTLAELSGAKGPDMVDGISFAPTLLGREGQAEHEFLYWELPQRGGLMRAVRAGRWKLIQAGPEREMELYHLEADLGEETDLARERPKVVERLSAWMEASHAAPREFPAEATRVGVGDYVR